MGIVPYNNELHSVGWVLNPRYRDFHQHSNRDVMADFYTVLEHMEELDSTQAVAELSKYRNREGISGLGLADSSSEKMVPSEWWTNFGSETPNLQRLARIVLRQPIAATRCEKHWSAYDHVLTKKRSRLCPERTEKLVYLYFNRNVIRKQFQL